MNLSTEITADISFQQSPPNLIPRELGNEKKANGPNTSRTAPLATFSDEVDSEVPVEMGMDVLQAGATNSTTEDAISMEVE